MRVQRRKGRYVGLVVFVKSVVAEEERILAYSKVVMDFARPGARVWQSFESTVMVAAI